MMKTCKQCHKKKPLADFYKSKVSEDGFCPWCKECCREYNALYRQSVKGRKRAVLGKKKYQKTKKGKTTQNEYNHSKKGKTFRKESYLRRKYKLTIEQHKQMYLNQNGCCAICGEPTPYEKITTDHNHKTDEVRKLLCQRCNVFVGYIEKYPELLNPILSYIKQKG